VEIPLAHQSPFRQALGTPALNSFSTNERGQIKGHNYNFFSNIKRYFRTIRGKDSAGKKIFGKMHGGPLTSLLARLESVSRVIQNKGTKAASAVAASATISDSTPILFAWNNIF
jgi:hypothetical protein